jgi:hypothetical protein
MANFSIEVQAAELMDMALIYFYFFRIKTTAFARIEIALIDQIICGNDRFEEELKNLCEQTDENNVHRIIAWVERQQINSVCRYKLCNQ